MIRYSFQTLVEATGRSESEVARTVGLSGTSLKMARERGLVERAADRCAVRMGLTPWVVWPDWLADLEVECAYGGCANRFVPAKKGHRFCEQRCARAAWNRSERGRESMRAAQAAWRDAARDYKRRYDRERKQRLRQERAA